MEENNFFGFVSKIGSLISSNKTKEPKKPKIGEKKYNIKISTDAEDEKEIDNIDDMEEEEEEDEEDNKGTEEEKNEREEKEKNIKDEKNKIENIVLDILNNNNNQKKEEESKNDLDEVKIEDNQENNINNLDNNNNINNINNDNLNSDQINSPQISNNSSQISNEQNEINNIIKYDDTFSCHLMLKKGNDINLNDYVIFPILFMEKQKNFFYKLGMTSSTNYELKKYLFFFDEHYLYFAKDEIIPEEMDDNTRRITKIVSLFDIKDFTNEHIYEQFIIKLTIKKELKEEKIINFKMEQKYFDTFIKNFNVKLSIYGIDFFSDNKESF